MNSDFLDAHHRHWEDAERLFHASRWANADHLYGMATECGLKRLMIVFEMPVESEGGPTQQTDRVHVNTAWTRYETYRSGHQKGINYGLPATNPFHDWHVSQRYAHQSHFDEARLQSHRGGAEFVHELIKEATREGHL